MPIFAALPLPCWRQWMLAALVLAAIPAARAESFATTKADDATATRLTRIRTGHFIVQASANGQPLRLIVDTGSPVTVINEPSYETLVPAGADAALPKGVTRLHSLNGRPTETGYLADLRVGGVSVGGERVAVAGLDRVLGGVAGAGANGILGADVLARRGAIIDLGAGSLTLGAGSSSRRELAQRAARAGYTAIALAPTTGAHLAVACILREDPVRFILDTGSPYTVAQRSAVDPQDLARPEGYAAMRSLGGVTNVEWTALRHWNIGAFPITRSRVGAGNFHGGIFEERTRSGAQVVGLLGLEWLTHWGAIIDFGSQTLYLKHP